MSEPFKHIVTGKTRSWLTDADGEQVRLRRWSDGEVWLQSMGDEGVLLDPERVAELGRWLMGEETT